MKGLILFSLIFTSYAHIPIFPTYSDCKLDDIVSESLAAYMTIPSKKTAKCSFNVKKGDPLNISISLPFFRFANKAKIQEVATLLSVSLVGPNATWTPACLEGWNGWGVKGDVGLNADFNDTVEYTEVFEPWGVGVYVPIRACSTTAPEDGTFFIMIENKGKDLPISIGAGTEENFAKLLVNQIYHFPLSPIIETWWWMAGFIRWSMVVVTVSVLTMGALAGWLKERPRVDEKYLLVDMPSIPSVSPNPARDRLSWFMYVLFILNSLQFAVVLIYYKSKKIDMGSKIWIPIGIHVFLPIIVCVYVSCMVKTHHANRKCTAIVHLLFIGYATLFVWFGIPIIAAVASLGLVLSLQCGGDSPAAIAPTTTDSNVVEQQLLPRRPISRLKGISKPDYLY